MGKARDERDRRGSRSEVRGFRTSNVESRLTSRVLRCYDGDRSNLRMTVDRLQQRSQTIAANATTFAACPAWNGSRPIRSGVAATAGKSAKRPQETLPMMQPVPTVTEAAAAMIPCADDGAAATAAGSYEYQGKPTTSVRRVASLSFGRSDPHLTPSEQRMPRVMPVPSGGVVEYICR